MFYIFKQACNISHLQPIKVHSVGKKKSFHILSVFLVVFGPHNVQIVYSPSVETIWNRAGYQTAPSNWGTMVLHWEKNHQQYRIPLARWKPITGVVYHTEVYTMGHKCVKNKSESNTRLFVRTSQFELQHEKTLSKKKPRLGTLLIQLLSGQRIVKILWKRRRGHINIYYAIMTR